MKKTAFTLTFLLLAGIAARAQVQVQEWTLEQCIRHAVINNLDIKMQEVNRESRAVELHSARSSRLPSLNANVGQNVNFGRSEQSNGVIANQSSYNTSLSLSSSMPLFTGFRIKNDIRTREYGVQAAEESLKRAKESITVAVAQAFLEVLLRKEIQKIGEENVKFTTENVKKTEVMVNAGNVPLSQLYEIKSQQASDEAALTSAMNNVALGMLALGQLLELQDLETFDVKLPTLADSATLGEVLSVPSAAIYEDALGVKPQIREAELLLEGSRYSLKSAESGYLPQLSLSAGLSDGYYYAPDNPMNPAFSDQLNTNLREYIGLSLQIPIFNRFQVKNNVRSAQLDISSRQLALEDAKKTLYKEIQQAYHNAVAAQKSYAAALKTVETSREAFRYADAKYKTGKSSVYELTESQTLLARSLAEEAQAKYSYVFAVKILEFYRGREIRL
jgi:outer membrane protein